MASRPRRSAYVPQEIDPRLQQIWAERGVMKASDSSPRPKYYDLVMYPYPSGDLTVGHARNYVMGDVLARMKRMQGHEVLHPFGWDAFGLPAENAAMRRGGGLHPGEWTLANIKKGKRELEQWFFKITDYAQRLLDDLDTLEHWPHKVRVMQTNWIGRSEGAEVDFPLAGPAGESVRIYTTRPDTLFGATFMVLAPEHPLVERVTTEKHRARVREYVEKARKETEIERLSTEREKTGVATGGFAINPVNDEKIPIWVA